MALAVSVPAPRARAADPAERTRRLVEALRSPARYRHPVDRVEVRETHISYVLLAGDFAYKVKKPVNLGFLDFRTLESRERYCAEEVRLNRRTAPSIYLDSVAITGSEDAPRLEGPGEPIEYAVRMRRFAEEALFERLAAARRLTDDDVIALGKRLAAFHHAAAAAPEGTDWGSPARVLDAALSNLGVLASLELPPDLLPTVEDLREWTLREHARIAPALARRVAGGFVRECHGDLHLGNIVQLDGAPVPFDAIEFSDELRWIDPMADIAFTAMDLERHGLDAHANRFLNAYLEESGDYGGVAVLRFYEVYRALVRAKIGSIRLGQAGLESHEKMAVRNSVRAHVLLAQRLSCPSTPRLVVMHGLSGSGKTVMSESLAASVGAIRIRSDVERKRLGGLGPLARSGSAVGAGLYSARRTAQTYDRLAELAESVLAEGYPVIVDATFLRRAERARFRDIAGRAGVAFTIASCSAPAEVLRRRLRARALGMNDASEADLAVLDLQLATQEPLVLSERERAIYL